jgi:hypothetical protein
VSFQNLDSTDVAAIVLDRRFPNFDLSTVAANVLDRRLPNSTSELP